jgi:hypothetical protein
MVKSQQFSCSSIDFDANKIPLIYSNHICQISSKELYISNEVLEQSNHRLGQIHSFIRLQIKSSAEPLTTNYNQSGLTLYAVEPTMSVDFYSEDNRSYHKELKPPEQEDSGMKEGSLKLWSDCFRISAFISGSVSDAVATQCGEIMKEEVVVGGSKHDQPRIIRPPALHPTLSNVGQRFGYAVLECMHDSLLRSESSSTQQTDRVVVSPPARLAQYAPTDECDDQLHQHPSPLKHHDFFVHLITTFDSKQLKSAETVVRRGCVDARSNFQSS